MNPAVKIMVISVDLYIYMVQHICHYNQKMDLGIDVQIALFSILMMGLCAFKPVNKPRPNT